MKKMMYGLLIMIMIMTSIMTSETVKAVNVVNIPQDQAQSLNAGNGANVGGAANTVAGTGRGAGGPGDGQGPGNGAGQGIGNGPSGSTDGSETTLSESSGVDASPAPEPGVLVLLGIGGLVIAYWLKKKKSSRSSHTVS